MKGEQSLKFEACGYLVKHVASNEVSTASIASYYIFHRVLLISNELFFLFEFFTIGEASRDLCNIVCGWVCAY